MAYEPFDFFFPTRIYFGAGESKKAPEYLARCTPKKVFVVTYSDFVLPALPEILAGLTARGIAYELYAKAVPNPHAEDVDAGAAAYRASGADFLLGVGGGSVIDTAKGVALLAANPTEGGIWDYVSYAKTPAHPAEPVGLVVSIASTGSESNESFVLTSPDGLQKLIYSVESVRPRFSVCDPVLSFTLPRRQTALGAADIFSHVLEQYLHNQPGVETSDNMSLGILKSVVRYAPVAMQEPENLAARSNLMWSSILAMSRLLGVGHAENWVCHMLEHAVSAKFNIPHAAGMTALTPAYLRYIAAEDTEGKLGKLASEVFGADATAEAAAKAVEDFFRTLSLPVTLTEAVGHAPSETEIASLAENAIPWGSMDAGLYRSFTVEDAKRVFALSSGKAGK